MEYPGTKQDNLSETDLTLEWLSLTTSVISRLDMYGLDLR